jgi:hypothetical protein
VFFRNVHHRWMAVHDTHEVTVGVERPGQP